MKFEDENILVIVVYVDDTIFDSKADYLSQKFVTKMKFEFQMSMFGGLSFFLCLQIKHISKNRGNLSKYVQGSCMLWGYEEENIVISKGALRLVGVV